MRDEFIADFYQRWEDEQGFPRIPRYVKVVFRSAYYDKWEIIKAIEQQMYEKYHQQDSEVARIDTA